MTQLGEGIAFGLDKDDPWSCPFDHKNQPPKQLKNVMPPWDKNDAHALGTALGDQYHFKVSLPIVVKGKAHEAQYTPHHLIPGNASWPKSQLQKWVDKRKNHINGHIGYDVNGFDNGVSLPGNAGFRAVTGGSWTAYAHQLEYAIAAMEESSPTRQFHDAHPAYNEFVIKVLDKISAKLDDKVKKDMPPGCGKKDCAGDKTKKKKFDPPYDLLKRLTRVALRLEGYLVGNPRQWRMPIYTSRFALMYKTKMSEAVAAQQLSDAQANPDQF
jgi:hypothetical protein